MAVTIELIIVLVVLICLSAFFSGSEIALFSLSDIKVRRMIRAKKHGAKMVLKLKSNPHRLLTTILTGNNIVNTSAAAIATVVFTDMFGNTGIGIATGVMTFILLIFGEITPKSLFYNNAEKVAPLVAHPVYIISKILYPVVFLIENMSGGIVFLFNPKRRKDSITEDDIKVTLSLGEKAGVLDKEEEEMMQNIFEFGDTTVKEVMTPRNRMVALPYNITLGDAITKMLESKYSRIPVYRKSLDDIVGILNLRQILKHIKKRSFGIKLEDIVSQAAFVSENKRLDDMMDYFKETGTHMAIVTDGHGHVKGLITMEDVLEEIVGEIYDEPDQKRFQVRFIDNKTAIVNGDTLVKELQEEIGIPFRSEKATISDLVSARFDGKPRKGSMLRMKNFILIVTRLDRHDPKKIFRLKIIKVRGKIRKGI